MTGREKVMIALVLVAGCYGVMQFRDRSESAKKKANQVDEIAEVNSSFVTLKKDINLAQKEQVVNLLGNPELVDENPFLTSKVEGSSKSVETPKQQYQVAADKFTYDGYFSIANSDMAIINGNEYQEGDVLTGFPLVVKQIESDWVELVSDEGWAVKVFYSTKQ